jgi:coproporphyrinogen III oxidase-like Fe-S oxidoreductase
MNVTRPQSYVRQVEIGAGLGLAADNDSLERIDSTTAMREHMLLGLRLLREGVNAGEFQNRFGLSLPEAFAEAIAYGLDRHWLEWVEADDGPHLRLSRPGYFLANQAIIRFI